MSASAVSEALVESDSVNRPEVVFVVRELLGLSKQFFQFSEIPNQVRKARPRGAADPQRSCCMCLENDRASYAMFSQVVISCETVPLGHS